MANAKDNAMNTATDNGNTDDMFQEETTHNELNRVELMNLTGKQLAKMAQPYSSKTLKVLEKTAKATLCDIILNKSENKPHEDKPHARESRTKSQTESFIENAVSLLEVMKRQRDDEPLNASAREIFTKQAVIYADQKATEGQMNVDKANTALFVISAGAILFDGLIGFKNSPTLFKKIKNKFFPQGKREIKSDDTK